MLIRKLLLFADNYNQPSFSSRQQASKWPALIVHNLWHSSAETPEMVGLWRTSFDAGKMCIVCAHKHFNRTRAFGLRAFIRCVPDAISARQRLLLILDCAQTDAHFVLCV